MRWHFGVWRGGRSRERLRLSLCVKTPDPVAEVAALVAEVAEVSDRVLEFLQQGEIGPWNGSTTNPS